MATFSPFNAEKMAFVGETRVSLGCFYNHCCPSPCVLLFSHSSFEFVVSSLCLLAELLCMIWCNNPQRPTFQMFMGIAEANVLESRPNINVVSTV